MLADRRNPTKKYISQYNDMIHTTPAFFQIYEEKRATTNLMKVQKKNTITLLVPDIQFLDVTSHHQQPC